MIRVLMVVTTLDRGGIENMLMNCYRAVDRSKVQFDFLTHRRHKFDFEDEVLELGGKIYRVSNVNPLPWSWYNKELDAFFDKHNEYRIVHSHINAFSAYVLRAAQKHGVPIRIAHSHTSKTEKTFKGFIKIISKRLLQLYCNYRFACGSDAARYLFGEKNYTNGRIKIINNAIDVERYRFNPTVRGTKRKELGITEDLVIGHVGRFFTPKNHDFIIDVFNEVLKREPKSKLLLVGTGEKESEIKEKVNGLGISENVEFLGVRSDVNEILQAMDIFLFPSLYEGLPVTLIEAQASGLKIAASSNIDNRVDITGNIKFLELDDGTQTWAEEMLKMKEYVRTDTSSAIIENNYDIKNNAKWLQDFYLNAYQQESKDG